MPTLVRGEAKAGARVIRFDRAATTLRSGATTSLAALAYDCGYADQSHLNRELESSRGRRRRRSEQP